MIQKIKKIATNKISEFVGVVGFLIIVLFGLFLFPDIGIFRDLSSALDIFSRVTWFVFSYILATLFTAYLVVIANTKFVIRFFAIPVWLVFSFLMVVVLNQFIGYPYPATPPKGELLSYHIIAKENKTRTIEMWMYHSNTNNTRAYELPYSLNLEKGLSEARRRSAQGERIEIELDGENELNRHEKSGTGLPGLTIHNMQNDILGLKEPSEQSTQQQNIVRPKTQKKPIVILPNGNKIEVDPGKSFRISPSGEIEIMSPAEWTKSKPTTEAEPTINHIKH